MNSHADENAGNLDGGRLRLAVVTAPISALIGGIGGGYGCNWVSSYVHGPYPQMRDSYLIYTSAALFSAVFLATLTVLWFGSTRRWQNGFVFGALLALPPTLIFTVVRVEEIIRDPRLLVLGWAGIPAIGAAVGVVLSRVVKPIGGAEQVGQFGLRNLLVVVAVCALLLGTVIAPIQRRREFFLARARVAAPIWQYGGDLYWSSWDNCAAEGVEECTLRDANIGDRELAEIVVHLEEFPHLSDLCLRGTAITDHSLQHLCKLRSLITLDVSGTRIAGEGLNHLTCLQDIAVLRLENTFVSDEALTALERLATLRSVVLRNTNVSAQGVARLQSALPECDISK